MRVLSIFLLLVCTTLHAQENQDPGKGEFPLAQLQIDFDLMVESIHEVHPATYQFISQDSLARAAAMYRAQLVDGMTAEAFHVIVRQYIAHIQCGHTTALPSSEWYAYQRDSVKLLPFEIWIEEGKLFIREGWDEESLLQTGSELLSIDQRPASQILAEMESIQERDGQAVTFVASKMERSFRTYYLFLYGNQKTYEVELLKPDGTKMTAAVAGGLRKPRTGSAGADPQKGEIRTSTATFYLSEEQSGLAILDINSFPRQGFRQFYDEVFGSIEENNINHLVLDLRNNGGGYFPNGNRLLTYLIEEKIVMKYHRKTNKVPKLEGLEMAFFSKMTAAGFNLMPDKDKEDPMRNHELDFKPRKKHSYSGKLYVLTNGGTFSMGSYAATLLSHHTDAILLGEETGGGEAGSNAILSYDLTLPATGVQVIIPRYTLNHDVTITQEGRGVIPDIEVEYSLAEKMSGIDKEMERVVGFVKGE